MLSTLVVLVLAGGDAVAEAGSAYRQAREALASEKYEQAVTLLRGAIQQVGEESDQLKYRDDESRRRHSYYPYYEWGRARLLQAQIETSIFTQRDLLSDAVGRLGQSRHPDASVKLEEAKAKLEDVAQAIALDGSFNAVKTRIEVLGNGERFVEAYQEHGVAVGKFKTRLKELEEVHVALKAKQLAAIKRCEVLLAQRLSDVVLMDPVTRGEAIVPMLAAAMVSEQISGEPGPKFVWAREFMTLWTREAETCKKASALPGSKVIATADAFDAAGLEALKVELPSGFRAARFLAQTVRMGKLRDIAAGNEDMLDTKTADAVAVSSAAALKRGNQAVSSLDKDVKDTLVNDLGTQERQGNDLAKAIRDGAKERERLTAPIVKAEAQLADGDTLGDLAALTQVKSDLGTLESDGSFGTLTLRLRARSLFAHGMVEAMLAFLEGKPEAGAIEVARVTAFRAFAFDPKIDERWNAQLSPKLKGVFDKIKPTGEDKPK
ncbi:MAG TPA: hypothetical protein VE981_07310 [Planctomycetota bacterium]|nr:hypothetical protein [Planctomycetota bacterium]